MTVLKQYNTGTSTWETVVVGQPGEAGIVNGTVAPADTSVLWLDTADTASQVAIPSGGTTGQILAKTSGTDYATGWIDGPSRNAIINGGFDIWQRGTSGMSGGWCADRWYSDTSSIVSRSTDVPANTGINYSAKFTGSTANTPLRQSVELPATGIQGVFYDGSAWTVSFYAKVSAGTRTIGLYVAFMSGVLSQSRQIFLDVSTNTATTSWQRFTYSFTVPSGDSVASATAVQVCPFIIGNASSVDVYITGVQIEPGSIATPFRRNTPNLQAELAACQRYCVVYGGNQPYERLAIGSSDSSTSARCAVILPVKMRATPTLSINTLSDWQVVVPGVVGVLMSSLAISTNESSPLIAAVTASFSSNGNFGSSKSVVICGNGNTNGRITLEAEL